MQSWWLSQRVPKHWQDCLSVSVVHRCEKREGVGFQSHEWSYFMMHVIPLDIIVRCTDIALYIFFLHMSLHQLVGNFPPHSFGVACMSAVY